MTFNSFLFYPFFTAIVIINYVLPKKRRWVWLLLASYTFYSLSDIRYSLVLLTLTFISYASGKIIANCENQQQKKTWLILSLVLNLGSLVLFKYMNFIFGSIGTITLTAGLQWKFNGFEIIYPIGISFYVFQIISYILDVFSGKIEAENNFFQYALFVSFFPQLLIGPIERYNHLKPQLVNPAPFVYQNFIDSFVRIGWGLFKKLVIADRLAIVANTVFASPENFESPKLIIAVLAFSFQIYIDFSAYCDIASGTASILGINLSENFERPYFAKSVIDFWRRWHISLSTWLRDYVFLKLNYKHRRKKPKEFWIGLDIMTTFLISGLWHGGNWTFIIWGALHGIYQTIEILTQKSRDNFVRKMKIDRTTFAHKIFQVLVTFGLISFAWIFFKANSITQAFYIIKTIGRFDHFFSNQAWIFSNGSLGLDVKDIGMMLLTLGLFLAVEFSQRKHNFLELLNHQPAWLRWIVYYILFFSITIFGYYGEANVVDFVYFQF